MVDEKQVNPRIPESIHKTLEQDALSMGLSVNQMASHILEQYYMIEYPRIKRGDVTIMRRVLEKIVRCSENKAELIQNATHSADEILSEIRTEVDDVSYDFLHKKIMEWHNSNKFKINRFENTERRKYVIKHDMGARWSEFHCIMYKTLFEKVGESVVGHNFNEFDFSFEIAFHQE